MINYRLNGKATIALSIVRLTKTDIVKMTEYFPSPKSSGIRVKIELDLTNYS